MKIKVILVIAAIIIVIAIDQFFCHCVSFSEAEITLTAPDTCGIGELVELDASASVASSFTWQVIPETSDFRIIERGSRALFCSGSPGKYLFVLAAAKGNTVDCEIKEIIVGSTVLDTFSSKVQTWLPADTDPKILEKLAKSFERVAAAGHDDIGTLIKTTALSNRAILGDDLDGYKPFLTAFSDYLKDNYSDEPIEKHIELWFKIASALRGN